MQVELRKVPLKHLRCDVEGMKKQIDSNTIMLVASCPEYAHGNFDPVPVIADMALRRGIGCHSDCCLGSFVNPFAKEAGFEPPFAYDFRVPGVTSVSCDPHKYALGPKGFSVLMFRTKELRRHMLFATCDWNGGMYGTASVAGSRPGNIIAGTWAALMKNGREGYLYQL